MNGNQAIREIERERDIALKEVEYLKSKLKEFNDRQDMRKKIDDLFKLDDHLIGMRQKRKWWKLW